VAGRIETEGMSNMLMSQVSLLLLKLLSLSAGSKYSLSKVTLKEADVAKAISGLKRRQLAALFDTFGVDDKAVNEMAKSPAWGTYVQAITALYGHYFLQGENVEGGLLTTNKSKLWKRLARKQDKSVTGLTDEQRASLRAFGEGLGTSEESDNFRSFLKILGVDLKQLEDRDVVYRNAAIALLKRGDNLLRLKAEIGRMKAADLSDAEKRLLEMKEEVYQKGFGLSGVSLSADQKAEWVIRHMNSLRERVREALTPADAGNPILPEEKHFKAVAWPSSSEEMENFRSTDMGRHAVAIFKEESARYDSAVAGSTPGILSSIFGHKDEETGERPISYLVSSGRETIEHRIADLSLRGFYVYLEEGIVTKSAILTAWDNFRDSSEESVYLAASERMYDALAKGEDVTDAKEEILGDLGIIIEPDDDTSLSLWWDGVTPSGMSEAEAHFRILDVKDIIDRFNRLDDFDVKNTPKEEVKGDWKEDRLAEILDSSDAVSKGQATRKEALDAFDALVAAKRTALEVSTVEKTVRGAWAGLKSSGEERSRTAQYLQTLVFKIRKTAGLVGTDERVLRSLSRGLEGWQASLIATKGSQRKANQFWADANLSKLRDISQKTWEKFHDLKADVIDRHGEEFVIAMASHEWSIRDDDLGYFVGMTFPEPRDEYKADRQAEYDSWASTPGAKTWSRKNYFWDLNLGNAVVGGQYENRSHVLARHCVGFKELDNPAYWGQYINWQWKKFHRQVRSYSELGLGGGDININTFETLMRKGLNLTELSSFNAWYARLAKDEEAKASSIRQIEEDEQDAYWASLEALVDAEAEAEAETQATQVAIVEGM